MRVGIFFVDVVRVVGRNYFHLILLCKAQQHFVYLILLFQLMALQFDVIILSKQIKPPLKFFLCFGFALAHNGLRHHGTQTTSGGN